MGTTTGPIGNREERSDSHCRDIQCRRRCGTGTAMVGKMSDFLIPSLVREPHRIVRLLLRQPPQRRHVPLIVEDVPRQDQCDGQSRHQPEHVGHRREDDPRDKVQWVRKLDVWTGTTVCSRRPSQAGG